MSKQRVVVCAAIRGKTGGIICGPRHYDSLMHDQIERMPISAARIFFHRSGNDQGFVDNFGVYMTREEALAVAEAAGQVIKKHDPKHELCSEDLY